GQYEEAIECFDRALERNGSCAKLWVNKGASLYGLGRYDEALLCFDKALEIDPSNEKAHKGMELILNGNGK
ncbi:MAG: tetratricopeptide repeat protein, partial [Candidatus Eremiobacterota bacterium]